MTVGGAIKEIVERVRDAGDVAERAIGNADVEFLRKLRLEFQRRDDGDEIGIAAALTQPVERALNLPRAGAQGRERVRHRLLGVVVSMDADMVAGNVFAHVADDFLHLVRQRPAVGVAEHDPARAFVVGRLRAGKRVSRIGLVAVKEMLAVEQHFAALGLAARTLSRIEARFSSSVVSSATRTW